MIVTTLIGISCFFFGAAVALAFALFLWAASTWEDGGEDGTAAVDVIPPAPADALVPRRIYPPATPTRTADGTPVDPGPPPLQAVLVDGPEDGRQLTVGPAVGTIVFQQSGSWHRYRRAPLRSLSTGRQAFIHVP